MVSRKTQSGWASKNIGLGLWAAALLTESNRDWMTAGDMVDFLIK
jgi:hypothetical protein